MDVISELIHYHSLNQFMKVQNRPILFVYKVKFSLFKQRFYKSFFEVIQKYSFGDGLIDYCSDEGCNSIDSLLGARWVWDHSHSSC